MPSFPQQLFPPPYDSDYSESSYSYQSPSYTRPRHPGGYKRQRSGYSPCKNPRTLLAKGFPYDANLTKIKGFFREFARDIEYVHFINDKYSGRFSGRCYVVFTDRVASLDARKALNMRYCGHRYIEMFKDAGQISQYVYSK